MPIKAIVTKLDDVEAGLRPLYRPTKGDDEPTGMFILDVEPANGLELRNFGKLIGALQEERGNAETAARKLKKFEALGSVDDIEKRLSTADSVAKKYEELAALDPKREAEKLADTKLQAALADIGKRHADELAKRDGAISGLKAQISRSLIDNEAMKALSASGVMPGHDQLLLRAIRDTARVVEKDGGEHVLEIVDANGAVRIKDANRTPFGMADLIAEMKTTYPGAFAASDGKGPGVPPGAGSGGGAPLGKKLSEMTPDEKAQIITEKGYDAFAAMLPGQAA